METPLVWSQHQSHRGIHLQPVKKKVIVNFGNTGSGTITPDSIVINPVEAVKVCKDKLVSKERMKAIRVPAPQFGLKITNRLRLPIVVKMKRHSGGRGMERIRTKAELKAFIGRHGQAKDFYWEKYVHFDREFRVHVSRYLRGEIFATEKVANYSGVWIRNLKSCKFVCQFKHPNEKRWKQMVHQCVRFLQSIGLDIGGFDIGYNARRKKFYIIECNSAAGMMERTRKAYIDELNRIIAIIGN